MSQGEIRSPSLPALPEPEAGLIELKGSVAVPRSGSMPRRLLAFMGPGYMIAVGYMDPGNWVTGIAAGSAFGYALLWVVALSSLAAMLLQGICARVGIATGQDLAQLCRDRFPRAAFPLWLMAEAAICATDLAEVIGTAIALKLLFGIGLLEGVMITTLDIFLLLWLQHKGLRWLEACIIALVLVVSLCLLVQLLLAQPAWGEALQGYWPSTAVLANERELYLALGIIGATVMPHNLYLHTALAQSRAVPPDPASRRQAIRLAGIDSCLALLLALLVNSGIMILAAAAFHAHGRGEVDALNEAHALLNPVLGGDAPLLFALALLACGLSSTITATLSGQVVMEGFLRINLPPALRRMVTRGIAITPSFFVIWIHGEEGVTGLVLLSQVVLALQLPFALVPLMLFASERQRLGPLATPRWQLVLGWFCAILLPLMALKLILAILP